MKTPPRWRRPLARTVLFLSIVGAITLWPAIGSATLIDDLNGNDPAVADAAYLQLFANGNTDTTATIDALLGNTGATGLYAGSAWINLESSVAVLTLDLPTDGVVSLYLVEAILRNRLTPHVLAQFDHASLTDQSTLFSIARSAYQDWWSGSGMHRGESISMLRTDPQPLDSSSVVWR